MNDNTDNYAILKGKNVLIVDDEPSSIELYSAYLKKVGANVITAHDGHNGIVVACNGSNIDVVSMDIKMSPVDGYDALREIRSHYDSIDQYLPVVAVTAYAMSDDEKKMLDAGFDAYLSKPTPKNVYLSTIASVLTKNSN